VAGRTKTSKDDYRAGEPMGAGNFQNREIDGEKNATDEPAQRPYPLWKDAIKAAQQPEVPAFYEFEEFLDDREVSLVQLAFVRADVFFDGNAIPQPLEPSTVSDWLHDDYPSPRLKHARKGFEARADKHVMEYQLHEGSVKLVGEGEILTCRFEKNHSIAEVFQFRPLPGHRD
jgi:hypothetical protein